MVLLRHDRVVAGGVNTLHFSFGARGTGRLTAIALDSLSVRNRTVAYMYEGCARARSAQHGKRNCKESFHGNSTSSEPPPVSVATLGSGVCVPPARWRQGPSQVTIDALRYIGQALLPCILVANSQEEGARQKDACGRGVAKEVKSLPNSLTPRCGHSMLARLILPALLALYTTQSRVAVCDSPDLPTLDTVPVPATLPTSRLAVVRAFMVYKVLMKHHHVASKCFVRQPSAHHN